MAEEQLTHVYTQTSDAKKKGIEIHHILYVLIITL